MTSYLMAIIMLALSVTILEIFAVEMCMTLTFTFKMDKGEIFTFLTLKMKVKNVEDFDENCH